MSLMPSVAEHALAAAKKSFDNAGLLLHEMGVSSGVVEVLGTQLDGRHEDADEPHHEASMAREGRDSLRARPHRGNQRPRAGGAAWALHVLWLGCAREFEHLLLPFPS